MADRSSEAAHHSREGTHRSRDYDDRVIAAAREVFAEHGFAAPMAEIAKRAGVGVASVYRRYESKEQLAEQARGVNMRRIIEEAESARAEAADPWDAFTRFLHRCLRAGSGVGAVFGSMNEHHVYSPEFRELTERMFATVGALVGDAQRDGSLRTDIGTADISLLFKHLNPALPTSEERRAELRARYLALAIEGMRAAPARPTLPGPSPDEHEVATICESRSP